jgi:ElaB/YqjD/DUF883 family membrane-anchored ribosome-binding protein
MGGTTMNDADLQKEFNALKRELETMRGEFGKLAEDTGRATAQASETAKAAVATALSKLEEEGKVLMDKLQNAGQGAVEAGEHAVSGVQAKIEEQPMVSTVTALGVGFVLGMLIGRKS